MQQPGIYPGFAIFRFPAGIVEISLRITVAILLVVCLVISAILIETNSNISSSQADKYYNFGFVSLTALGVVTVTATALILELIYFVFRFLNIRCYNNCYVVFGILDIVRYILLAICLLLGLAGYAAGSEFARDSAGSCDRRSESMGEVDTACEELRDRAIELTIYAVLCAVSIVTIGVSVVWEIIYLVAGCNNRLPVPKVDNV